ncbi:MAG TPA: hypothetical protein VMV57_11395, partial [Terracidiphilus sp.]|nr:hypothetical protein [Terracidiphilus sp.]
MRSNFALLALVFAALSLSAQPAVGPSAQPDSQPDPPHHDWHASWITHPTAPLREPLVLHFRRSLTLASVPASYIVRVSADNRFILYVNGQRVGDGPARGDLTHWRYERYNLAPYLHSGQNLVTATVWNFGIYAPIAQFSDRTAFLLESEDVGPDSISTPKDWLIEEDPGRSPLPRSTVTIHGYMASGPGELLDAAHHPWNWQDPATPGNWLPAASPMRDSIYGGVNRAHSADTTGDNPWGLVPDTLPHMQYSETTVGAAVVFPDLPDRDALHKSGTLTVTDQASEHPPLRILPEFVPAHRHVHILLDRRTLTTAYPALTVSGGKGSKIWITYSEALYDNHFHKGDRDALTYTDAQGINHPRLALGLRDEFLPDGGAQRTFQPLWWRTWRYLDLDITTGAEPLTLDALTAHFTAYPFVERASFTPGAPNDASLSWGKTSPDPDLAKIWQISWRTARLDAHETYMDTPYWEQLQYIGDTRIQALISYAVADDDRLAVQALQAFADSRTPNGLTRSRYPSSLPQTIPTFSLLWIGMLHDYWMYRPDPAPVRESLPGARNVLGWFAQYQQPDGLLRQVPWWSFIDWVSSGETPTYAANGESCITTLEYLGALRNAADLEHSLGD